MNRFEFYKSLYEGEEKKWAELNDSLNISLAIIAVIGAAIYTFNTNFHYSEFNFNTWIFVILCSISGLLLLISIIFLINVFALSYLHDYDYRPLGYTDELEGHFMSLQNKYPNSNLERVAMIIKDFENFLIGKYVLSCGANSRINGRKSYYLKIGKEFLVGSLVFVIVAFFPFIVNHFYHILLR